VSTRQNRKLVYNVMLRNLITAVVEMQYINGAELKGNIRFRLTCTISVGYFL